MTLNMVGFFVNAKTVSMTAVSSIFLLHIGLTLLWPLFSSSLRPVLMVPGYSQVSGGRKNLFCCFGSPVSVGSQGKGWGGVAPPLTSV